MGATTGGMSRAAMTFAPAKFAIETRSSTDLPITAAPPVPSATKQQHKNYDDQDHFHGNLCSAFIGNGLHAYSRSHRCNLSAEHPNNAR